MKLLQWLGSIFRHPTRSALFLSFVALIYLASINSDISGYISDIKYGIKDKRGVAFVVSSQSTSTNTTSPKRDIAEHTQSVDEIPPYYRSGEPQNRLVYVKIEKTGSSTFSNIFSSYGLRHKLNMVMSTIPESLVNTRELEPGNSWDVGPNRSDPHIMEQHARYNHAFYMKNFANNTAYVTSLRHPVKWFISYVDFMGVYRRTNPRQVLQRDRLFYKRRHFITGMQRHIHNNFLQWLGFDVYKSHNLKAIREYIKFVDQRFKLVMFTEYFDESLVLLKRLMNWSMADIFYTYANEATRRSGTVFTEDEKATLLDKHHNLGDMMLYEHFNKTFWEKIELQPEFFDEVAVFRHLNKKVQQFCFSKELRRDKKLRLLLKTRWEDEFMIKNRDCLSIRVRDGKAEEFADALDKYIPTRNSKRVRDLSLMYMI